MESGDLLEKSAMEISVQKIALKINDKIQEYKETKDEKVKLELLELLRDRDLVYSNNRETIRKYLNDRSK